MLGNKRVFRVEADCIILNIVFAWEGAVSTTSAKEAGFIASHRFPMFRPDPDLDLNYLRLVLQHPQGVRWLGSISPGGAGRNKTMNQSSFLAGRIPVPPLEEQELMGACISSTEANIEKQESSLAGLREVKAAILAALTSGRLRVGAVSEEAA